MTIGKKIGGSFGLLLVTLIAVGILSYRSTAQLIDANRLVARTHEILGHLEDLMTLVIEAETGQRGYIITGNRDFLEPYQAALDRHDQLLRELRELTEDNPRQQRRLDTLQNLLGDEFDYLKKTIVQRRKEGFEAAAAVVKQKLGKTRTDRIRKLIRDIRKEEETQRQQRLDEAEASAEVTSYTVGIGTGLALVFVALAGFLLVRSITGPVYRLLEGTEKIGRGALDHRVNITTEDEIGNLARAFDRMTEKRQRALEAIRKAVGQLSSASTEILATTTEQAAGAQEQAAAVAQTVTTVNQVTQTAEQAAQRARAVGEAVQRTQEVGKAGRKVVEDSLTALQALNEQVQATAENIQTLAEQAQAIGEIIATVNDVAEQTNLLALNAAIEASRAGEHGRGFAVVAGEVKALADQSKKATAKVRQILGEIQKATSTTVLSTEQVTRGVAAAIQVGGQAGETIKTLAEALAEAARAASQIVASVGQQATGMAQIHQAMKNIDQAAQQNTVATRQASQAAEDLNALGIQLAELTE